MMQQLYRKVVAWFLARLLLIAVQTTHLDKETMGKYAKDERDYLDEYRIRPYHRASSPASEWGKLFVHNPRTGAVGPRTSDGDTPTKLQEDKR